MQRLRSISDAILVGVGTIISDDPSLRVHWELLGEPAGKTPIRVVIDGSGRAPASARVLDGSLPTLIGTTERATRRYPDHVQTIQAGQSSVDLSNLLEKLLRRGVGRVLVEGGAHVLASVLRGRLFDRLTVFVAPMVIGGATAPSMVLGIDPPSPGFPVPLELTSLERLGNGSLLTYSPATREFLGLSPAAVS